MSHAMSAPSRTAPQYPAPAPAAAQGAPLRRKSVPDAQPAAAHAAAAPAPATTSAYVGMQAFDLEAQPSAPRAPAFGPGLKATWRGIKAPVSWYRSGGLGNSVAKHTWRWAFGEMALGAIGVGLLFGALSNRTDDDLPDPGMIGAGAGMVLVAMLAIPATFTYGAYRRGFGPAFERDMVQAAYNYRVYQNSNYN